MVWLNYEHHNTAVPPGVYGGAMCVCEECEKKRASRTKELEIAKDNFFGLDDDWEEIWTG